MIKIPQILASRLRPFEFGISLPNQVQLGLGQVVFLPLEVRRGSKTAEGPITFNIQAPKELESAIAVDDSLVFVSILIEEALQGEHYLIVSALLDGQRRSARCLVSSKNP